MKAFRGALALLLIAVMIGSAALAAEDGAASGENSPPVAENQELQTYRGVSLGGQLSAFDPDGDDIAFELVTEPMKGTVELSPDGYFVYTPKEGKRGRDYFGFRAVDSLGNASQEGTVIIRLVKQKTKLTYADMTGSGSEYAAVMLTEKGVFTGASLGADSVFDPEDTVTRGEFLVLCMNAADCDILSGVQSTGFADDGDIDGWLKPYVATALMRGYIRGLASDEGPVFRPDETISLRDACVMWNAVLGVTDVVSASYFDDMESPAAQAVANLTAAGVLPVGDADLDAYVTRADAAELISAGMELLARR